MITIIPEIKSPGQRVALAFAGALFFSILFLLSLPRDASDLPKEFFFFLTVYTKEVFPVQVIMMIAWYVTGVKPLGSRVNEYRFLSGLPVGPEQIFMRFFISDLLRLLWVPTINIVLLSMLVQVSSVNYVAPLVFFSLVSFILCCALLHWLHLFTPGINASNEYLTRYNPLLISVTIPLYMIGNILFLGWNNEFNAPVFCLIALVVPILSLVLLRGGAKRFEVLDRRNYWLKQSAGEGAGNTGSPGIFRRKGYALLSRMDINPLFARNFRQSRISSTPKLNSLLMLAFITLAYLVSRNNEHAEEMISVMQGIMLIFYAVYGYTIVNRLDPSIESQALIYSLPIRKRDFYLSVYVPPFVTLMLINVLVTAWLFGTTHLPGACLVFWRNSSVGIVLWITTAVNYGVANYPDIAMAKKRLLYHYFGYLILGAVFYNYFWITLLILFMLTFIQLKNFKLYH